jgi:hypothetical protein
MKNTYRILVGKYERGDHPGRPCCRKENNIEMDLSETGCENVDWIQLAQDKDKWRVLVNKVMNFRVPQKAENFLTI